MPISAITTNPTPAVTAGGAACKPPDAIDWASSAIQQAVATINDAAGKYSLDQQLAAYNWIVDLAKAGPAPGQTTSPLTAQAQAALEALSPPFALSTAGAAVHSGPPGDAANAAQPGYAQGSIVDTRA